MSRMVTVHLPVRQARLLLGIARNTLHNVDDRRAVKSINDEAAKRAAIEMIADWHDIVGSLSTGIDLYYLAVQANIEREGL